MTLPPIEETHPGRPARAASSLASQALAGIVSGPEEAGGPGGLGGPGGPGGPGGLGGPGGVGGAGGRLSPAAPAARREPGERSALNLARQPFVNTRPVTRVAMLMWLAGALLALVALSLFWSYLGRSEQTRSALDQARRDTERESQAIAQVEAQLAGMNLEQQNREVAYLNRKIAERTFSWSLLFDRLAEVLPDGVRLIRLSPQGLGGKDQPSRAGGPLVPEKPTEVTLSLTGQAKNDEALLQFVDRLFAHPFFRDPNLMREEKGEDGLLRFDLKVQYLPQTQNETPPGESEDQAGALPASPGIGPKRSGAGGARPGAGAAGGTRGTRPGAGVRGGILGTRPGAGAAGGTLGMGPGAGAPGGGTPGARPGAFGARGAQGARGAAPGATAASPGGARDPRAGAAPPATPSGGARSVIPSRNLPRPTPQPGAASSTPALRPPAAPLSPGDRR